MGKSTLGLSDILDKIKNEFIQMDKKSDKKGKFEFTFNDIEVEISFLVSKRGKAGINFIVAEIGGDYTKEQVHKIKFRITPHKLEYNTIENEHRQPPDYQRWLDSNRERGYRKIKVSVKKAKRVKFSAKKRAR